MSRLWWWVCVLCSFSWNPPPAHWSCRCWVRGGSPGTHLLSVGRLIVVSDQAYHLCVFRKFDDDIGAVCGCTVVCVQGVQEWAEDAALRSTSVEMDQRTRGDEILLLILTTWLLPVRMSRIQLQRDLFSSRVWSFITSVASSMVLNAEL